ncbi:multidrug efflux RND transporter permease subunit [Kushneria pakistanensis]|uniref:Efflux pump membrane transporter n=1 Tax=Kushneria pakistanensis TaxID=1508770 RepID=A0ABQ3FQ58_9GAMM|nr:efflux RND transporter permease subunit [Kushneria pakistanensis]GHC33012.1 multidrug efflux RND transporter permease subunit [Kushneria pakistanensis]
MSRFFIERPVFAWVIALFIILAGLLALPRLPVAQYPAVAPPQIELAMTYPGASAEAIDAGVVSLVEEELNGVNHLLYFSSDSSQGMATITVTFEPSTNPELARVDIQNRIKSVESRLPAAVRQQGIQVDEVSAGFLMMVTLSSPDNSLDETALSDYMVRNVANELRRVQGVGKAQVFGAERAMRIWLDPARLVAYNLTPADVNQAIADQNIQIPAGSIGDLPSSSEQEITAPVVLDGQLSTPEAFEAIILKDNGRGARVTIGDVARVEIGSQSYGYGTRLNGKPAVAMGIQLAPGANAMSTATQVRERMAALSGQLPAGMAYQIPYDTSPFVKASITQVIHTLIEAMILVFAVMFLFLQNIRYTLIPALVVPVALLGTLACMYLFGFSVNVLTMFAMVLAIGILVDDAIVVVENVERLMVEQRLSPREATRRAMGEISGAIIGITLVLCAVFIPMAFMSGSVGVIYRQFSMAMAVSILLSAFLALTLTPALCATLLKPMTKGEAHRHKGFFGGFNRGFERITNGYTRWVGHAIGRIGRYLVVYAMLLLVMAFLFWRLPSSFLPVEDQGYVMTDIQLPAGASENRTIEVARQIEAFDDQDNDIDSTLILLGFSFSGSGQNAALGFTTLKDWQARSDKGDADSVAQRLNDAFSRISEAVVYSLLPPPIDGMGTSSGFEFQLQDRGGHGQAALTAARDQLLEKAASSKQVANVREAALPQTPQVRIEIDRRKASALGVAYQDIGSTLSTALGSSYVNDFPNNGRMQQVIVQAEGSQRQQVESLMAFEVRNSEGRMVPLSAMATAQWESGPAQLSRYNGYSAVNISGEPGRGTSSGEAMKAIEAMVSTLPDGYAIEWTGTSLQERLSGNQAPALLVLSLLVVFLCLAALYESWAIPLSVMLVVPLGIIGAVVMVSLRGMPNDVFFKVGLVTIIGLSAKNAILIIEFAKSLHEQGMPLREACIQAARQRFRPIIMTSMAFILGVVPLAIASGVSSASQKAIGTGVVGGMLSATLAIVFVPVFFMLVMGTLARWRKRRGNNVQDSVQDQ